MKTYSLISDFFLSTSIKVGGKMQTVIFSGGSRNAGTKGFFSTDNKELQAAIEKDSGYGKVFCCFSGVEAKAPEVKVPPTGTIPNTENTGQELTPEEKLSQNPFYEYLRDKDNAVIEKTVTSKNTAAAWFQANKGVVLDAKTAQEAKKEAAEKHNVLFPNWK